MKFQQIISGLVLVVSGALVGSAGMAVFADHILAEHHSEMQEHLNLELAEFRAKAIKLGVGTYVTDPQTGESTFCLVGKKNPNHESIHQQVVRLRADHHETGSK